MGCACWALWCGPAKAAPLPARVLVAVDGGHVQRPAWGPDGRLSWELNFHDRKELQLWVGPIDGSPTRIRPPARARSSLTAGFQTASRDGVAHELAWSPAALGTFAYTATTAGDDHDLFVGGAAVVRSPGADGGATWSPDGRWLVFSSARTGDGDLYALEVARIEAPPVQLTTDPRHAELHAAFGPDGRLVYVGRSRAGDNLWLLPAIGAQPVQLTDTPGSQLRPSFSPDGRWVAFYANTPGSDRFGLFAMEARPGAPWVQLLASVVVDGGGPAWLDAQTLIAVADEDDAFDPVVRVGLDGARAEVPTGTVGNRELSVGRREGQVWLAWTAQGTRTGVVRDFQRLYVAPLP